MQRLITSSNFNTKSNIKNTSPLHFAENELVESQVLGSLKDRML